MAHLAGLPVLVVLYLMAGLVIDASVGAQYLIGRAGVGVLYFIVLEIDRDTLSISDER